MSLPRAVHAVVFDMDGLLVDTETVAREAMGLAAREQGVELPDDVFIRMVGLNFATSGPLLAAHFGPAFDVPAFQAESTRLFRAAGEMGVALKEGVVELLDLLDELKLPRAIATSSPHTDVDRNLGGHGLRERFDAVVAGGDYPRSKPFPDPFLKAAEALGVDHHSLGHEHRTGRRHQGHCELHGGRLEEATSGINAPMLADGGAVAASEVRS